MKKRFEICLVASAPDGGENLGLACVAGALKQHGFPVTVRLFLGHDEMARLAKEIRRRDYPLIGVAIPSAEAALDMVVFVSLLRRIGFSGHVCAGGAYATLARERLLCRGNIDSIVRYDGEIPFVALARTIASGGVVEGIPGISTAAGDGPTAALNSAIDAGTRPLRTRFRKYAGVKSARISAVRGCFGTCAYCGISALRKAEKHEHRKNGCESSFMGIRRRPVADVADEMATLYHQNGVRFFHFVDENHLPKSRPAAARVIHELCDALDVRGVQQRAVSLMIRADAATDEVMDALDRLGLARCLLGVESVSDAGLDLLGRGQNVRQNAEAVKRLDRMRVMYHYNVMIVHPDSTIDTIRQEILGLQDVTDGLLEPLQVNVYQGTGLFERLQREGRLLGGPYLWHYWPQEPEAKRFAEFFYLLRRDAPALQALTGYAYDVLGGLSVVDRLGKMRGESETLRKRGRGLIHSHNRLWRDVLQRIDLLVTNHASPDEVRTLISQTQLEAARLILMAGALERSIKARCRSGFVFDVRAVSGAAAAAMAISILSNAGCSRMDNVEEDSDSAADYSTETISTDSAGDTGSDSESSGNTDSGTETDTGICNEEAAASQTLQAMDFMSGICGWGNCIGDVFQSQSSYREPSWYCSYTLDSDGRVIGLKRLFQGEESIITGEYAECVVNALSEQRFPCIADFQPVWQGFVILLE